MRVLHYSKHQKLILQCYPPGKAVDKKPNPLELSYLLYYASTRRVKLEKVISFLNHKTATDAKGNKLGNLQVTLRIVLALIEKCSDNLNAFAEQVCEILACILRVGEIQLHKLLVKTYGVLCATLDDGLFAGDKQFVDNFVKLSDEIIAIGARKLQDKLSPAHKEWHMVTLTACRHVFSCPGFSPLVSDHFIAKCVPILAQTIRETALHANLLTRLNSNLNVENEVERRISVSRSRPAAKPVADSEENSILENDLKDEAIEGLRTLFNTSLSHRLAEGTKAVVDFTFKKSGEDNEWGVTFVEMCASWIPVQLRFNALLTLLGSLTAMSDKAGKEGGSFPKTAHYARNVLGLVSLNFNMIGLSIADVIQLLLTLQSNTYLSSSESLTGNQVAELSSIYSQCVCNLSTHIYYFDQVLDSIESILMQIDTTLLVSTNAHHPAKVHDLVLVLLENISTVLVFLQKGNSSISRNRATLENWDVSLSLLTIRKLFSEFAASASATQIASIELKYLEVFKLFMLRELTDADSGKDDELVKRFLTPNCNDYIENLQNFIASLFAHVDDHLDELSGEDFAVVQSITDVLITLLRISGINFVHNFLPFFQLWQLKNAPSSAAEITKDTLAYVLLKCLLEVVEALYGDEFKGKVLTSALGKAVDSDISSRKKLGAWASIVEGDSSEKLRSGETSPSTDVSPQLIHDFFAGTSIGSWINIQRQVTVGLTDDGLVFHDAHDTGNLNSKSQIENSFEARNNQTSGSGGFGLGNTFDIASIQLGLAHSGSKNSTNKAADTSHITADTIPTYGSYNDVSYRYGLVPRVLDLKSTVEGQQQPDGHFLFEKLPPRQSVLQRQIFTTDVSSILSGLEYGDDREIVV